MDSSKSAKKSLQLAREHRKAGRYPEALEEYHWFFDNALEHRPSYYGVRLSYCLAEWHDVGKKYRPALDRLELVGRESLERFLSSGDDEKFHDFQAIFAELSDTQEVMETFVMLDEQQPELAKQAWRYSKKYFIRAEAWDLCSKYLTKPTYECDTLLMKFTKSIGVYLREPELFSNSDAQIVGWLVTDSHNVLRVLKNSGRHEEEQQALKQIKSYLESEGYEQHIKAVSSYA